MKRKNTCSTNELSATAEARSLGRHRRLKEKSEGHHLRRKAQKKVGVVVHCVLLG